MTNKLSFEGKCARLDLECMERSSNFYARKLYEDDTTLYVGDKDNLRRIRNNNRLWRKEILEYITDLESRVKNDKSVKKT